MGGIYEIKNLVNGKRYIGKSIKIKSRWSQHISDLRKNRHHNIYLQRSWNKYGEENFEFNVLFKSDDNDILNESERYFIEKLKSLYEEHGYNLTRGGDSYVLSDFSREKLRGLGSNLSFNDVRQIKLMLYCLMDRNEICKKFNIDKSVVSSIAQCQNFEYLCSELNEDIFNLKQKMIDERNEVILNYFDNGITITEISRTMELSTSIVEKCVYKFRNPQEEKLDKYKKIYDEVWKLHNEGINNYRISKALKISPSTVQRYLSGSNNPYKELPFKKVTNSVKNQIIEMYFSLDIPIKNISKSLNVSRNTIEFYVNKHKYANTEVTN